MLFLLKDCFKDIFNLLSTLRAFNVTLSTFGRLSNHKVLAKGQQNVVARILELKAFTYSRKTRKAVFRLKEYFEMFNSTFINMPLLHFQLFCDKTFNVSNAYCSPIVLSHPNLVTRKGGTPATLFVAGLIHYNSHSDVYENFFRWLKQKCPKLTKIVMHDRRVETSLENCRKLADENDYIPSGSAPEHRVKKKKNKKSKAAAETPLSREEYEALMNRRKKNVNFFLHTDQERAIVLGAKRGIPGIIIVICARHLAMSTMRWLKDNLKDKELINIIVVKLFYAKDAAVRKKKQSEAIRAFDTVLSLLDEENEGEQKETHEYLVTHVRETLLEIVAYVEDRKDYFDTPAHYTSNCSESFNNKLKGMLDHETVSITQLITELWRMSYAQLEDVERVLLNKGQYQLTNAAKEHLKSFRDKDTKAFKITIAKEDGAKLRQVMKKLHSLPEKTKEEMEKQWEQTQKKHEKKLEKLEKERNENAALEESDNEEENAQEEEATNDSDSDDNLFSNFGNVEGVELVEEKNVSYSNSDGSEEDENDDQEPDEVEGNADDRQVQEQEEEEDQDDEDNSTIAKHEKLVEKAKKKRDEAAKKTAPVLVKDANTGLTSQKQGIKKKIGQSQGSKSHRTKTPIKKKKKKPEFI